MATLSLVNGSVYWNGSTIPYTDSRCCCGVPFPGYGWYCILNWSSETYSTCDGPFNCGGGTCTLIETEAEWDSYTFGTCQLNPFPPPLNPSILYTTDYVKHASEVACIAAGCACA